MKVVIKKAGQMPEVKEIENELHELQEIVGGYIEALTCLIIFFVYVTKRENLIV